MGRPHLTLGEPWATEKTGKRKFPEIYPAAIHSGFNHQPEFKMATKAAVFKKFEKSPMDKEAKGVKEGSKKDMAMDKKQLPAFLKKK